MNDKEIKILIIGMSKMGKTHFGGQLYGRLKEMESEFKLRETPADLSLFKGVLSRLNDGLEGEHTSSSLHNTVTLPIEFNEDSQLDIIYPDYGGEQLREIVEQRKISQIWQNQIQNSNHWFLFIRLDLMENISDVTTKFYNQIQQETINTTIKGITDLPHNSSAFYIELLQIFLSVKKVSISSINKPKLTIVLSCWDKMECRDMELPKQKFKEKMPILSNFITSVWSRKQFQIIGLSSLGQDLDKDTPNRDYQIDGPEKFGFIVQPNGERENDITKILSFAIE